MARCSGDEELSEREGMWALLFMAFVSGLAEFVGLHAWDIVASFNHETIAKHLQALWQDESSRRQLLASLLVVGNLLVSMWVGFRSRGLAAIQAWSASSVVYCILHLTAITVHGTVDVAGPALAFMDVSYLVMSMCLLVHLHKQGDLAKSALELCAATALLLAMLSLYASRSGMQLQISLYVSVFGMLSAAAFWWYTRSALSKWLSLLLLAYPVALTGRVVATEFSDIAFGFWSMYQLFCYAKIAIASLQKKSTAEVATISSSADGFFEA